MPIFRRRGVVIMVKVKVIRISPIYG